MYGSSLLRLQVTILSVLVDNTPDVARAKASDANVAVEFKIVDGLSLTDLEASLSKQ